MNQRTLSRIITIPLLYITLITTGCNRSSPQSIPEDHNNYGNETIISTPRPTEPSESVETLERILEAIANAYGESYLPNVAMEEESLNREFPVDPNMVEEIKGVMSMINVHPDRVVVIKAVEGKGEEIERQLWEIHASMLEDPLQFAINIPKIQAARVVRNGDIVCFLLVGAYSGDADATEEELLEHFKNEVSIGVKAFEEFFINQSTTR